MLTSLIAYTSSPILNSTIALPLEIDCPSGTLNSITVLPPFSIPASSVFVTKVPPERVFSLAVTSNLTAAP